MPIGRAVRTLTMCVDVAMFLWRRHNSVPPASAPDTDPHPVAQPGTKQVVPDAAGTSAEDLSREQTRTVTFGLDGQNYAIDLTDDAAAELRDTVGRYIAAGRRVSRQARTGTPGPTNPRVRQQASADGQDSAAIREWAHANGHRISGRGPIPATVRQAYDARPRVRAR